MADASTLIQFSSDSTINQNLHRIKITIVLTSVQSTSVTSSEIWTHWGLKCRIQGSISTISVIRGFRILVHVSANEERSRIMRTDVDNNVLNYTVIRRSSK